MTDNKSISSKEEADISPEDVLESKITDSKENALPNSNSEGKNESSVLSVTKDSVKEFDKDIPLPASIQENSCESDLQEAKLKHDMEELVVADSSVESKATEFNPAALTTEHSLKSDEIKEKQGTTSKAEVKDNSNISGYEKSDLETTKDKAVSSSKLEAKEEKTPTPSELKTKENTEFHTTSDVSEQISFPTEIHISNETNLPAKAEIDEFTDQTTHMAKEDSKKGMESVDNPLLKEATARVPDNAAESTQDMFGMTEEEALAFLKEENDAKKALASTGPPKIELYGSSVSGNMKIKKAQNKMIDTLERFKISYDFVDLAADEQAKLYIKRKNPTSTTIPQLYIDGEFKMEFEEFEELLEYDELFEALGVEPDF